MVSKIKGNIIKYQKNNQLFYENNNNILPKNTSEITGRNSYLNPLSEIDIDDKKVKDRMKYLVLEAKQFLREYKEDIAVSISGGKDSLVVLDLALKVGIKKVIYCDTTMAFPGTNEYIDELDSFYLDKVDSIIRVKAPREFFELVQIIGFPSRRLRWCCEVYKFGPLAVYLKKNKIKNLITGLRSDESIKRKNYSKIGKNPLVPAVQVNPIIEWTSKDVWYYIKMNKLPYHFAYNRGFSRLGCWSCPFMGKKIFQTFADEFPEHMKILKNSLTIFVNNIGNVGINNKEDYVENFGWLANAIPQQTTIIGSIFYHTTKNKKIKLYEYKIEFTNNGDLDKFEKNLFLIKPFIFDYSSTRNDKIVKFKSKSLDQSKILIYSEKQVNCVGCGACRSLCKYNAIFTENNFYNISRSNCKNCLDCLSTSKMRGACIARNYMPIRKQFNLLNQIDEELEIQKIFLKNSKRRIWSPIKDGMGKIEINLKFGRIRTRKSLESVIINLKNFIIHVLEEEYIYSVISDTITISTNFFMISVQSYKGLTVIQLKSTESYLDYSIKEIIRAIKDAT